jgi:hypothetical protein
MSDARPREARAASGSPSPARQHLLVFSASDAGLA